MAKVLLVFLCACVGAILGQHHPNVIQPVHHPSGPVGREAHPGSQHQPNFPRHDDNGLAAFVGQQGVQSRQQVEPQPGQFEGHHFDGFNGQQFPEHRAVDFGRFSNDFGEPSNYDFMYLVSDPQYRVGYGHLEQRHGENTNGIYHVLLPDGRTQQVEYIADQEGYRPIITYHEPGTPVNTYSGFGRSNLHGFNHPGNTPFNVNTHPGQGHF